jgi:hypothetical protein
MNRNKVYATLSNPKSPAWKKNFIGNRGFLYEYENIGNFKSKEHEQSISSANLSKCSSLHSLRKFVPLERSFIHKYFGRRQEM